MLRIITDFDGPIMDISERYYRVYKFCLENTRRLDQIVTELSKTQFWDLKRSHTPETQIAIISGLEPNQAQEFARLRHQTAHSLPYFEYDRIQPYALDTLQKIQQAEIDLVVLTLRRLKELEVAFNCYKLDKFFPKNRCYCLTNDYVKTSDIEDKPILMTQALAALPAASDTWMIGDTEADIVAAKQQGIKVIGVLSGIRDRQQLSLYKPDLIVNDFTEAVTFILCQSQQLTVNC